MIRMILGAVLTAAGSFAFFDEPPANSPFRDPENFRTESPAIPRPEQPARPEPVTPSPDDDDLFQPAPADLFQPAPEEEKFVPRGEDAFTPRPRGETPRPQGEDAPQRTPDFVPPPFDEPAEGPRPERRIPDRPREAAPPAEGPVSLESDIQYFHADGAPETEKPGTADVRKRYVVTDARVTSEKQIEMRYRGGNTRLVITGQAAHGEQPQTLNVKCTIEEAGQLVRFTSTGSADGAEVRVIEFQAEGTAGLESEQQFRQLAELLQREARRASVAGFEEESRWFRGALRDLERQSRLARVEKEIREHQAALDGLRSEAAALARQGERAGAPRPQQGAMAIDEIRGVRRIGAVRRPGADVPHSSEVVEEQPDIVEFPMGVTDRAGQPARVRVTRADVELVQTLGLLRREINRLNAEVQELREALQNR